MLVDVSLQCCLPLVLASFILVLIPYIQIGLVYSKLWVPNKEPVNIKTCDCSCFDTIFRGSFEDQPVGYKDIYWNATGATLLIYTLYVINIILWYKAIEYVCLLLLNSKRGGHWFTDIRWGFFLLVLVNIFPNYYSWWSYFIYINERMWSFAKHHLAFYISELIVTGLSLSLMDAGFNAGGKSTGGDIISPSRPTGSSPTSLTEWHSLNKIAWIVSISVVHVIVGGLDQFVADLVFGYTRFTSQLYRDVFLLLPDIMHIILPLALLRMDRRGASSITLHNASSERHGKYLIYRSIGFIVVACVLLKSV